MVGSGVLLVALGLLFLVGAGGHASRYAVAFVSMLAGAVLTGFGLRLHRRLEASSPEQLRAEILALARREDGELSGADVDAALGRRRAGAVAVIEDLVRAGTCRRESREGATFYVFESLLPRLVVKRCGYCDFEAPISEKTGECPKCGGALRTAVAAQSLSGGPELYGMDE